MQHACLESHSTRKGLPRFRGQAGIPSPHQKHYCLKADSDTAWCHPSQGDFTGAQALKCWAPKVTRITLCHNIVLAIASDHLLSRTILGVVGQSRWNCEVSQPHGLIQSACLERDDSKHVSIFSVTNALHLRPCFTDIYL